MTRKLISYDPQPFGPRVISVTSVESITANDGSPSYLKNQAAAGWVRVTGTIQSGKEVSRLWTATSARDLTGQPVSGLAMPRTAYDKGQYITVACG